MTSDIFLALKGNTRREVSMNECMNVQRQRHKNNSKPLMVYIHSVQSFTTAIYLNNNEIYKKKKTFEIFIKITSLRSLSDIIRPLPSTSKPFTRHLNQSKLILLFRKHPNAANDINGQSIEVAISPTIQQQTNSTRRARLLCKNWPL